MNRARPKNNKSSSLRGSAKKYTRDTEYEYSSDVHMINNDTVYGPIVNRVSEKKTRRVKRIKKKTNRGKKRVSRIFKKIFISLLAIIIILFTLMGFGFFDSEDLLMPLENDKINVLLLGVDEEGLRTDAIMVASYDVKNAQVNMLSVPRDTKIYVSNRKVTRKINEIHALSSKKRTGEILGAEASAQAVTQLTGIPINYYAEFSFSAIDRLFDILGPVTFDVPDVEGNGRGMNYDDPAQNLHIHLKPGMQELAGNQVQQFLRYRKSNSKKSDGSDTRRVERQLEFVKAVFDQKVNPDLFLKMPSIMGQLTKEIKTNISFGDIKKYALNITKLTSESIHTYSLPGETKTISGGSYYVCNLEETAAMVRETFGYDASEITDKMDISDEFSQKVIVAGNMTNNKLKKKEEQTAAPKSKTTQKPNSTKAPVKSLPPSKSPDVTKSPTKAPVVTKKPQEVEEEQIKEENYYSEIE